MSQHTQWKHLLTIGDNYNPQRGYQSRYSAIAPTNLHATPTALLTTYTNTNLPSATQQNGHNRLHFSSIPHLTNTLQNGYCSPEVADVKDGQFEVHIAEVAHTVGKGLATGIAVAVLGAGALNMAGEGFCWNSAGTALIVEDFMIVYLILIRPLCQINDHGAAITDLTLIISTKFCFDSIKNSKQ